VNVQGAAPLQLPHARERSQYIGTELPSRFLVRAPMELTPSGRGRSVPIIRSSGFDLPTIPRKKVRARRSDGYEPDTAVIRREIREQQSANVTKPQTGANAVA
jgi:hypothetical protein